MTTIHDVAKRAGVASITVSRVINKSGPFSEDVRERVEAAIAELGYVPNTLARSLRSKRTNTLALVVTDITNPFFTSIARGVEDTASDAGFTVIYCNTDESEAEEKKYLRMLLQKQVDGILLVPARSSPQGAELIRSQNTPVVVLDRRIPGFQADIVRSDTEKGAYQLVRLLLDLGHRVIAVLSGPKEVSTAVDRVSGFKKAMKEAGVASLAGLIYHGAFNQAGGYAMAKQALSCVPRPTALLAGNNFIAAGALQAIKEQGMKVPDDIAIVAIDDLPHLDIFFPFLTVVAQDGYDMGKKATELLLSHLGGASGVPFQELILPTRMIVRLSSGDRLPDRTQAQG